jgi:hypothetical protein
MFSISAKYKKLTVSHDYVRQEDLFSNILANFNVKERFLRCDLQKVVITQLSKGGPLHIASAFLVLLHGLRAVINAERPIQYY